MIISVFSAPLRSVLLGLALLLSVAPARAQTAPVAAHGYDFLTVITSESGSKNYSKILIIPAFQGKSEIALEDYNGLNTEKYLERIQHNTQIINQQLSDLTIAGWELAATQVVSYIGNIPSTRYLFRKPRP